MNLYCKIINYLVPVVGWLVVAKLQLAVVISWYIFSEYLLGVDITRGFGGALKVLTTRI